MKQLRKNAGFTLVELMVTILVASVVTLSATTILLLGVRIMHKSQNTVERQNTTRVLMMALEKLAMDGTISTVQSEPDSWQVQDKNAKAIYSYDSETNAIYVGNPATGTPILDGVISSDASLEDHVLTFSLETETGSYTSSVYCRLPLDKQQVDETGTNLINRLNTDGSNIDDLIQDQSIPLWGRKNFLRILASQHGSRGYIINERGMPGEFYSKWYNENWETDTPWCACYISWALSQEGVYGYVTRPTEAGHTEKWYANVDQFMAYFEGESRLGDHSYTPIPGDLVFFDWSVDNVDDPEHVGVVLTIADYGEKTYVYTIEGNTANRVAVRKYPLNDERIIGYGVLDWTQ